MPGRPGAVMRLDSGWDFFTTRFLFMDRLVLDQMLDIEDRHWWYCARRRVIQAVLRRFAAPAGEVLEIGCGGGGNLAMLSEFGAVRGVEMDEDARAAAGLRHGLVVNGWLPDGLPFSPDERFARVALLDVLEHVPDDRGALRRIRDLLVPGGQLVVTVPAYTWLWRRQDDLNHHQRRYTRPDLRAKVLAAGLEVVHASYYNTLLFPLIAGTILGNRCIGREQKDDNLVPAPTINTLLTRVFGAERHLVPSWQLPFGASLITVARRPL